MDALEKGEREGGSKRAAFIDDLPLFATPAPQAAPPSAPSPLEDRLKDILPDELTPKDALNLIYELKGLTK